MSASSCRGAPRRTFAALAAGIAFALSASRAGPAQLPLRSSGPLLAHAAPHPTSHQAAFLYKQALALVLDTFWSARSTLQVAACSFTCLFTSPFTGRPTAAALQDARRRGVKGAAIIDASETARACCAARSLAFERVPRRANAPDAREHNKSIVADGTAVQTGGFNDEATAAQDGA